MITRFFSVFSKLKALKTHGRLMLHAFRHADTPKWIKGVMLAVVVYLFSPIDLLPDFLVLFGITDDLVVISGAAWFLGKVIPEHVKRSLPPEPVQLPAPKQQQYRRKWVIVLLLAVVLLGVLTSDWFQIHVPGISSLIPWGNTPAVQ